MKKIGSRPILKPNKEQNFVKNFQSKMWKIKKIEKIEK